MTKAETCAEALAKGGIAVLPTDTVYGIFASAFSDRGIEKIFKIKKRDKKKPLQVFFPSAALVSVVAELTPKKKKLLDKYLPGPYTVILKLKKGFKKAFPFLPGETIGVRIIENEFIRQAILKTGAPLAATSANISGAPSPVKFKDIAPVILKKAGFVSKNDRLVSGRPSAIVDMTGAKVKVIKR